MKNQVCSSVGDRGAVVGSVGTVVGARSEFARGVLGAVLAFGVVVVASVASAQVVTFSNHDAFLAATGAVDRAPFANAGVIPGGVGATHVHDGMTFSVVAPSTTFYVGTGTSFDWTALLSGHEIAISGPENLNVALAQPAHAIGFFFVDPTTPVAPDNGGFVACSAVCPCQDTTYDATLRRTGVAGVVGTFTFRVDRNTAGYVGVSSRLPFDRLEIRERGTACDNEYFGRFAISMRPPCVADLDDGTGTGTPDGGVTIEDLLYYIGIYAEGAIRADLDDGSGGGTPDGGVTIDDLLYYLQRFEAGC